MTRALQGLEALIARRERWLRVHQRRGPALPVRRGRRARRELARWRRRPAVPRGRTTAEGSWRLAGETLGRPTERRLRRVADARRDLVRAQAAPAQQRGRDLHPPAREMTEGGSPTSAAKRDPNAERDMPTVRARASMVHARSGSACILAPSQPPAPSGCRRSQ
jgi:hypothetical protein